MTFDEASLDWRKDRYCYSKKFGHAVALIVHGPDVPGGVQGEFERDAKGISGREIERGRIAARRRKFAHAIAQLVHDP